VNLVHPVREYMDSLVHASVRGDPLASARHRVFIASRIFCGLVALAALPVYLVARGALSVGEAIVFAWFIAPIAIACFLSRTGRYESAQVLWAVALTALILVSAGMTGGLSSPFALWLVLVPVEAALCASRRIVAATAGLALAAAALLFALDGAGLSLLPAAAAAENHAVLAASITAATIYAALLALAAGSFVRAGRALLAAEEKRYRLLALNMTDVISRHGRGGTVSFVSPAVEKLFGVQPRELMGHGLFDRVHVSDRPAYLSALADAGLGVADISVEFRARRRMPGAERDDFIWIEMRCRSLGGSGAELLADMPHDVVAVMRDVSERKAQERAIAEAHSEVEQANAAKGRFLATMSHELRTPLNAVIGFSEMLMNEQEMQIDADRRLEYARLIHDSGQHLLSVVNLVLDMSKIETGNFVITAEPFAPAPVIRNCCDLLTLKARDAGLDIVIDLPPDLPEIVADKRSLKQMLLNLLSNAIKFTDRGGHVRVSAETASDELVVAIEDTGVGISETDLPRIGNAFFQASSSYDRSYDGTGLGLSIVKGLVELHGGRLDVKSRVGVGTRMVLRLPLDCEARVGKFGTLVALPRAGAEDAAVSPAASRVVEPTVSTEVRKSA